MSRGFAANCKPSHTHPFWAVFRNSFDIRQKKNIQDEKKKLLSALVQWVVTSRRYHNNSWETC
jgi:hypothetical protein